MKVQRIGTYKTGFKYFNRNNEITDEKQLDFFKSLKIKKSLIQEGHFSE